MKNKILENKKIAIIVAAVLLVLIAMFSVYKVNTSAISSTSEEISFAIVEGDTLDSITTKLEEQGIVKNKTFAKITGKLHGDTEFQVGVFMLDKSWNASEILSYLNNPENIIKNEKMVTFKEGMWANEIAKTLGDDSDFDVTENELLNLWNDTSFLKKCIKKYDFLDSSILNDDTRVKLEGFLYPETYCISYDASAEDITYIFLDQFDVYYQEHKKEFKASDYSTYELVTLASMVQYEASNVEDMKKIAGVFYNRLNKGMALGSSVTVCYALYDDLDKSDPNSWQDCEANTDIDSPYNTYENAGLPVGPIENPGSDALDAVLNPTASDYLYFMADVNGDGTVYYAKTLEEHNANVKKYLGY